MRNSENAKKWAKDICDALNDAGFEMEFEINGDKKYKPEKFSHNSELIEMHVAFYRPIYDYLNSKGLINRGYCPIMGTPIQNEYAYRFFDRAVFLSTEGLFECKTIRESKNSGVKNIDALKSQSHNQPEDGCLRKSMILLFIVLIIFLIKKIFQ